MPKKVLSKTWTKLNRLSCNALKIDLPLTKKVKMQGKIKIYGEVIHEQTVWKYRK
ncbi:MAG: hypothetical protein KGV44_09275 [Flavobacteriaceae bacterium]|nr:hypothetical protein [Flavobacteriaceae bacterium]